jgi:hypothetical protein
MQDKEFKADIYYRSQAEWATLDPYVPQNDLCIESDTGRMKVGIGLKYSATQYVPTASSVSSVNGQTGAVTVSTGKPLGLILSLT